MKQTHLIEVAPTKATTREQVEYFCDICALAITNKGRYTKYVCDICNRDCHNNGKCGNDHPEDYGDYPRTLCRICLDLWAEHMKPLQDASEKAEEAMLLAIKELSNANNATS